MDPGSARPYQKIAAELRLQIIDGALPAGFPIPAIKLIAQEHHVSVGTAQRAVGLLRDWGLVEVVPGRNTLVRSFSAVATNRATAGVDVSEESRPEPDSGAKPLRRSRDFARSGGPFATGVAAADAVFAPRVTADLPEPGCR
ncbi:MAG: GntR family transcriptional regulator [Jiangellaceae bacterium]